MEVTAEVKFLVSLKICDHVSSSQVEGFIWVSGIGIAWEEYSVTRLDDFWTFWEQNFLNK